jgi:ferric-dicitrate binding protein FerR (iron transport regulator)
VAENKSKPFIVHTTLADIKVVGTEFNVISTGTELTVSVLRGRVIVIAEGKSDTLTVGEMARIQPGFQGVKKGKAGNPNDLAYATHTLIFNDVSLGEVFRSIEKSYPYVIDVLNKDIENCKLTGTFERATADKILAIIAETLNLTVTKNDNHFTIEGKGCPLYLFCDIFFRFFFCQRPESKP